MEMLQIPESLKNLSAAGYEHRKLIFKGIHFPRFITVSPYFPCFGYFKKWSKSSATCDLGFNSGR